MKPIRISSTINKADQNYSEIQKKEIPNRREIGGQININTTNFDISRYPIVQRIPIIDSRQGNDLVGIQRKTADPTR